MGEQPFICDWIILSLKVSLTIFQRASRNNWLSSSMSTSGSKVDGGSLMNRAVNPNNPESKAKLSEEIIAFVDPPLGRLRLTL